MEKYVIQYFGKYLIEIRILNGVSYPIYGPFEKAKQMSLVDAETALVEIADKGCKLLQL